MFREAPIENGIFDYTEFTRILKHGAKDKDEQWHEIQVVYWFTRMSKAILPGHSDNLYFDFITFATRIRINTF